VVKGAYPAPGTHQAVEARQIVFEHRLVQGKKGGERPVLRGGRDLVLRGESAEQRRHRRRAHFGWVPLAIVEDEQVAESQELFSVRRL
jgi:hypothetical protein